MLGGFRLFIGLVLIGFGCCCDIDWYNIGTSLRFVSGLGGAFLILGNAKTGMGYLIFLVIGLIGYCYTIQSGKLCELEWPIIIEGVTNTYSWCLEGWLKYSLRLLFAFIFMCGYRDTRDN
jgi:hypothetical protein